MAVFHGLTVETELGAADARIEGIGLQAEAHLWLGRVLGEEALADHLGRAHLVEIDLGHRQAVAVHAAQAIAARVAADEGPHVGFEEAFGDALRLEELAEIADRDIAGAVRVERVALVDRLAVETVQLALVALVEVQVGIAEDQPPGVFGQHAEPSAKRSRQSCGGVAQVAQGIALAAHAALRHVESRLLRLAGARQSGELQLQLVERLQQWGEVGRRAVVIVEQAMQGLEAALQGLLRGIRQVLRQRVPGLAGRRGGRLAQLAALFRGLVAGLCQRLGALRQDRETGVLTDLQQQLEDRRVGGEQPGNLVGALAGIVERQQAQASDRLAPEVRVVAEIQLLEFDHQAPQVHVADPAALAQDPVVAKDVVDQAGALDHEVLLVALLGVEPRDHVVGADEQTGLRPQVLAEAILGQASRLFAQHPVDHVGQGLAAQHLARLGHQGVVQRIAERLLEQTGEMRVQAILHGAVAGIALRPVVSHPVLEPSVLAALAQIQHQVGPQAVEQAFAILHVAADLRFEHPRHARQQLRLQLAAIGSGQRWVDLVALVQPGALVQRDFAFGRKHGGRRIAAIQRLQRRHGVIALAKRLALLGPLLRQLADPLQALVVGRETASPEQAE